MRHGAGGADQPGQGFGFLGAAAQLGQMALAFHELFVADVHGHEDQRSRPAANEALHRHRQYSGLGCQHAAAAAASAFDEILDRKAARQHQMQVFVEDRCVQWLTLEAPAQEEGATPAQQRTDERQIEIGTGCDMRWCQPLADDQVGQQEVVDVTAVTGDVDDLVARGDLRDDVEMVELDPLVQASP